MTIRARVTESGGGRRNVVRGRSLSVAIPYIMVASNLPTRSPSPVAWVVGARLTGAARRGSAL